MSTTNQCAGNINRNSQFDSWIVTSSWGRPIFFALVMCNAQNWQLLNTKTPFSNIWKRLHSAVNGQIGWKCNIRPGNGHFTQQIGNTICFKQLNSIFGSIKSDSLRLQNHFWTRVVQYFVSKHCHNYLHEYIKKNQTKNTNQHSTINAHNSLWNFYGKWISTNFRRLDNYAGKFT